MSVSDSTSPAPTTCSRCGLINPGNAQTCDCGWRLRAPLEPRSKTPRVFVFFVLLDLTLFILAAFVAWSLLPLGGIILLSIWPLWYVVLVVGLFLMLRKITWLTLGAFRFGYDGRSLWRSVRQQMRRYPAK